MEGATAVTACTIVCLGDGVVLGGTEWNCADSCRSRFTQDWAATQSAPSFSDMGSHPTWVLSILCVACFCMGRDAQSRWIANSRTQALGHPWLVGRLGAAMLSLLRWCQAADIFWAGWVACAFQSCRNPVSEIVGNPLLSVLEALSLGKPCCNETWAAELSYVLGNGQFPVGFDAKVQMFFLPLKKKKTALTSLGQLQQARVQKQDMPVRMAAWLSLPPRAITERGVAASSGAPAQSRAETKEKFSWFLVFLLNNLLSTWQNLWEPRWWNVKLSCPFV